MSDAKSTTALHACMRRKGHKQQRCVPEQHYCMHLSTCFLHSTEAATGNWRATRLSNSFFTTALAAQRRHKPDGARRLPLQESLGASVAALHMRTVLLSDSQASHAFQPATSHVSMSQSLPSYLTVLMPHGLHLACVSAMHVMTGHLSACQTTSHV